MSWLRNLLSREKKPRLHWLSEDLALAAAPEADEWALIREAGIRGVVDLRAETPDNGDVVRASGLAYLRLPVTEHEAPSEAELRLVTDWVLARMADDGPVLVHCREGRGRSALVACASLVRLGLPLPNAFQTLHKARPEVALSPSQERVLERFATTVRENLQARDNQGNR